MQIKQVQAKVVFGFLTGLLILETITRGLLPSHSVWLEYARQAPNNFVRSGWTPNWRGRINIDGVGGQQGTYELNINPFGFRGQSMRTAEKPDKTFRVFFIGGSFVEQMALPEEKTFPSLIEKKLTATFPDRRVECVNAGISGFMSPDLVLQFQHQILNYQPDLLVVTAPAINDVRFGTLPEYDPAHPLPQNPEKKSSTLLSRSRLLHALYRFVGRYQQAHTPYSHSLKKFQAAAKATVYTSTQQSKAYDVFIRHLQTVIQLAKKEGVKIILMSEPSIYQTPLPPEIKEILWMGFMREDLNLSPHFLEKEMRSFNQASRMLAEQEETPFFDLSNSVPKSTAYFYDDVHLTPAGSHAVAEALYSAIQNLIPKTTLR